MPKFEELNNLIINYIKNNQSDSQMYQQILELAKSMSIPEDAVASIIADRSQSMFEMASNDSNSGFVSDQMGSGFVPNDNSALKQDDNSLGSGFVKDETGNDTGFSTGNQNKIQNINKVEKFSQVEKISSQGAMSDVYSAVQYGVKKVIIKRIKEQYKNDKNYIDLFFKEFEIGYQLDHENIVQFYEKGEDENGCFFVMEFIDGRTIRQMLLNKENLSEDLLKRIFVEIYSALKYMHKKQIYHRDLKPENIMITYRGDNVKVMDFGLSLKEGFFKDLKKAGTPIYASPEQSVDASKSDQRSDIFSMGLIITEIFTGKASVDAVNQIKNPIFKQIAQKSTQINPNDRFDNCDQILNILNQKNTQSALVPAWLEEKIKEFAQDGVITENEGKALVMYSEQAGIKLSVIQTLVDVELEKAKKELQEKEKQSRLEQKRKIDEEILLTQQKIEQTKQKSIEVKQQSAPQNIPPFVPQDNSNKNEQTIQGRTKNFNPALENSRRQQHPTYIGTEKVVKPRQRSSAFAWVLVLLLLAVLIAFFYGGKSTITSQPKDFTPTELYTTANVNLRELASENSKVITTVPKGKKVIIKKELTNWYQVEVDGKRGYMHKDFLKK